MTSILEPTGGSILGHAVKRREDPALIRGERHYTGDLAPEGTVHVAFVRSTEAHGRIVDIDVSMVPDGVSVFTGADVDLRVTPPPMIPAEFSRPILARDRVRYVGDLVAAVVAPTEQEARDVADLVWVDVDPLPPVADPDRSLDDDAPVLFPEAGTNLAWSGTRGNSDDPLADAEVIVRQRFVQQRLAPMPMEPAAILVQPVDGRLLVQMGTQDPSRAKRVISTVLDIKPDAVRVLVPAVGGGFGAKGSPTAEHVLVAALAHRLGRPVRWLERRTENLINMVHGRAQTQYVELGATRDGRVTGLKARYRQDGGAYPTIATSMGDYTMMMSSGVYDIPKMSLEAHGVVTNRTPVGPYRGAGRPEAAQMLERMMDLLAIELDMDPVEVRRINLIEPFSGRRDVNTGIAYDSGAYEAALDEALEIADMAALRAEQARRREAGDTLQLGIGVSCYVETTVGITPPRDTGGVTVGTDGTITVRAGGSSHGQAHQTTFAQIAASIFDVPMDDIVVIQSDTDQITDGVAGTYASRTIQLVGSSVKTASDDVIATAKQIAGRKLEASESDLVQVRGGLGVAGVPGAEISWQDLAIEAEAQGIRLSADAMFETERSTFPFGAHVAVVEVDVETGWARLVRHLSMDDCGNIINPMLVMGQQHGGVAQGVGQALFEEARFDEAANPLTPNLMSYMIPTAVDLPMIETARTTTPSPLNPLGAKGVGEAGTLGSTPAIHSAVLNALRPYGVKHIDMPLTPQKVWAAMQEAPG